MLEAAEAYPRTRFYGQRQLQPLPTGRTDRSRSIGIKKIHEDWGSTPAVIDAHH